jgi:hypothetical protein
MKALLLCFLLNIPTAFGIHLGVAGYKDTFNVQDKDGEKEEKPWSTMYFIGHNFYNVIDSFTFSPQFAYINNKVISNDSYNEYKVSTYVIMYDFIWIPNSFSMSNTGLGVRFGISNFIKKVEGEGGTKTVPNGSSTVEAYRPDETQTSYTTAYNLGLDLQLKILQDYFSSVGLQAQMFFFSPTNEEKTSRSYHLGLVAHF